MRRDLTAAVAPLARRDGRNMAKEISRNFRTTITILSYSLYYCAVPPQASKFVFYLFFC